MLRALIWDVDGTLAETERDGHRVAFNAAFDELGVPWRWDVATYGLLLRTAGGYERLLHDMAGRADAPRSDAERATLARRIHRCKNDRYEEIVRSGAIPLRPGVVRLIDECCERGVLLGIATTTGRRNVASLLSVHLGADWSRRFAAVVCAEEAPRKKPDPLAYRLACDELGIDAADAIAVEDSPNGLAAATTCGIATVVTRSAYFEAAAFDGAAAICDDLDRPAAWAGGCADRVDVALLRQCLEH